MKTLLYFAGALANSFALADEVFASQAKAKAVLGSVFKSNIESDCFENKYCNEWSEMKEGGENIKRLQPFFKRSIRNRSKYTATKEAFETYKDCHKADKRCRRKGNYCACTTLMKNHLGLPLSPILKKERKQIGATGLTEEIPSCERNCYRVPSDRLKKCGDKKNLMVCHACGLYFFNDGGHDWKKVVGDENYDNIACTDIPLGWKKTTRIGSKKELNTFQMTATAQRNLGKRANACVREVFEYADNEIIPPSGGLGKVTSWTGCFAFCGTTDLLVPDTANDPRCTDTCRQLSDKVAGACKGDQFCVEMCLINEDLWSVNGVKRCQSVCRSYCKVFHVLDLARKVPVFFLG